MMWISKGLLPGVAMVALMVILVTGSAASHTTISLCGQTAPQWQEI